MRKQNILEQAFAIFDRYPRHYFIFGFFVLFFLHIVWHTFSYTVINYDFYKNLADNQQIATQKVPVTRWTIYSSWQQSTVLATSVNLDDLAIDPQVEWSKEKLWEFLVDITYDQFCRFESTSSCYNSMRKFLKVLEIPEFRADESSVKSLIEKKIIEKINKNRVTSVALSVELDKEKLATIDSFSLPWVYVWEDIIYVNPEEIVDIDYTVKKMLDVFVYDSEDLKYAMRKRDLRYVPILNRMTISNSEKIKEYILEERQAIKRWILDIENSIYKFIILNPNPSRFYPENSVGAQIIGFVDNNANGQYGVEWFFDDSLQWEASEVVNRKDIKWRVLNPVELGAQQVNLKWANILTTIDRSIQKKVEQIIEWWVKRYRATKWTIVVMEPKTGRVLSMANYPTFDLNTPGDVYELERITPDKYEDLETDFLWIDLFVEDLVNGEELYYDSKKIFLRKATDDEKLNPVLVKYKYKNDFGAGVYRNDAITGLYEPGSIMKTITVAIGIDAGEITRYGWYNDTGIVKIDEFRIKNVSKKCLWFHTFAHALNYSCNVWMVRIAQKYGKAIAYEYLNKFGFSTKTNITLDGEVTREIPHYEKWSRAKLFTSSYGLGIGVTPLQMATAYSTLVNGGIYITPKIIDKLQLNDGRVIEYKSEKTHRVIKQETSDIMIDMLVDSITNGSAKNGYVPGYRAWWKTGTSQIATKWVYEEWVWSTFASFAWFGPAEDPKFVIIVKLDRPKTNEFGGQTAAFLFKETAEFLFGYYGIPKRSQ